MASTYDSTTGREFSCIGNRFIIEVNGHQHERKPAHELYELLTYTPPPQLTKVGKAAKRLASVGTHKDPDVHFYCAQLIHYGLKPLKTKGPAKKRLLEAFGDGNTLAVPKATLELEKSLRKEWREANTVAQKKDGKPNKQKVKRDPEASLTKAIKATMNSMTKAQLRNRIDTIPETQARKILAKLLDKGPAFEQMLKEELASDARNQDNRPKICNESKGILEWQGVYDITSPDLDELGTDYGVKGSFTLEMYQSSTNSHLWAAFDFGVVSGIMRSKTPPPSAMDTKVSYRWRGREAGENIMLYGDDNKGVMTFLGDGKIKCRMEGGRLGKFKFVAHFDNKWGIKSDIQRLMTVKTWKAEWRGINENNYECENRARWGGWGGEERGESAAESDTTDGHGMNVDVDEELYFDEEDDEGQEKDDDESQDDDSDDSDEGDA